MFVPLNPLFLLLHYILNLWKNSEFSRIVVSPRILCTFFYHSPNVCYLSSHKQEYFMFEWRCQNKIKTLFLFFSYKLARLTVFSVLEISWISVVIGEDPTVYKSQLLACCDLLAFLCWVHVSTRRSHSLPTFDFSVCLLEFTRSELCERNLTVYLNFNFCERNLAFKICSCARVC